MSHNVNAATKSSMMEGLLTSVKARLEKEETTLKLVIGMLKNAREHQELEEEMMAKLGATPNLRETTIPEAVKGCGEAAYCDRAVAWQEAYYFCESLRDLEAQVDRYTQQIHQTAELGPNTVAAEVTEHLMWLKGCIKEHTVKLRLVHTLLSQARSLEVYMDDHLTQAFDRMFHLPRETPVNASVKEAMNTDNIMAELYACQLLCHVLKMQANIDAYRQRAAHGIIVI